MRASPSNSINALGRSRRPLLRRARARALMALARAPSAVRCGRVIGRDVGQRVERRPTMIDARPYRSATRQRVSQQTSLDGLTARGANLGRRRAHLRLGRRGHAQPADSERPRRPLASCDSRLAAETHESIISITASPLDDGHSGSEAPPSARTLRRAAGEGRRFGRISALELIYCGF